MNNKYLEKVINQIMDKKMSNKIIPDTTYYGKYIKYKKKYLNIKK
jgi:hypothetical protein